MRAGRGGAVALLLALVLLSTGRSLGNGFPFDDVPIVVENAQIHELAPPWTYAAQSYWPPLDLGDAYRPWTVWALALQYAVLGPEPALFHALNLLLTAAVTLAVFALARELVPRPAALAGAALFAVHPVHVEATGNVVGQGELWMALFTVAAVVLYARSRRAGVPGPRARLGIAGLYLLAAASKEQGLVLPGLLLAYEAIVVAPGMAWRTRARELWPTGVLLAVTGGGFLLARHLVLGDLGGGPPAAGLAGLDAPERAAVMLPLVLEWVRLLAWPRDLAAQYSPPEFGASAAWTMAATAGAVVAGGLVVTAVAVRKLAPALTLGLAWAGIALLPVSNLAFPTGILLAERTLFLPSVGAALIAAGIVARLIRPAGIPAAASSGALESNREAAGRSGVSGRLVWAVVIALVVAGAARSWSRQAVWKNNETLFRQTIADAPGSYRASFIYARDLFKRNELARAKAMYARAAALYAGDRRVFEDWGFILRSEGRCDLAVLVLERGVAAEPAETLARSRLFECLLTLRRYDEALATAVDGLAHGATEFTSSVERARALVDSTTQLDR